MNEEQHVPVMKFDMVSHKDNILKTKMEDFDFSDPPIDPVRLSEDMIDTMMAQQGLGLSANQCGLPFRMFVMRGEPFHAVFNPRIVSYSDEEVTMEEGCLSYPGLYTMIKRPIEIRCRYQTPNGETVTNTFGGMTARVFQHEFDHMEGNVFLMRANRLHRERAMRKWKQLQRKAKHESN